MTLSSETEGTAQRSTSGAESFSAVEAHPRLSDVVDVEMPDSDDHMMDSLRSHVPITLLMDLSSPDGPHSAEIAEQEGGDADWLGAGEHTE